MGSDPKKSVFSKYLLFSHFRFSCITWIAAFTLFIACECVFARLRVFDFVSQLGGSKSFDS